ncbi:MAG: DUF167 domain-containing protein [Calditerrivibrio sp.]|nr:DUF167 domain-containing protein [Calditerrivibrio sp.]
MKLKVYVQPGSKKQCFDGFFNEHVKIKLKSPPLDGKANEELIDFLSEKLGISKKEIRLISGDKSRYKLIDIGSEIDIKDFLKILNG